MKKLFAPAVWLVGRLAYPHKLILAALAFLLPLVFLAALLLLAQQKALDSTHHERAGLALQLPALELLVALHAHHAGIQAAAAGDAGFQQQLPKRKEGVENALSQLRSVTESAFTGADESTVWAELGKQWQALKAESPDASAGLESHLALNRLLRSGLSTLSDTSRVRVDSDPAIAALVDSVSIKLPLLVESLGLARDIGLAAIISQRLKTKLRNHLLVVRGGIDPLIGWNIENIEKAIALRPELKAPLEAPLSTLGSAPLALQEVLTTKVLDTTDFDIAPADYDGRGSLAIASALELARAVIPEVDKRLAAREDDVRFQRNAVFTLIIVLLLALVYGFIGAYLSIVRGIDDLSLAARSMAGGDLSARVRPTSRDEVGALATHFNEMADSFALLIGNTVAAASDLTRSAEQVHDSSAQIESAAEKQNEAVARTASAVQQLTVSVHEVAENARETDRVTARADEAAHQGTLRAGDATREMELIVSGVRQAVELIGNLETQSRQISTIVRTIQEIADQTNLLALNAAIEAARAGDHGRGFSVVADEVRKLAERTRGSTLEVSETVGAIQRDIQHAVKMMNQSSEQVGGGAAMLTELSTLLVNIRHTVNVASRHIVDIVNATSEQSKASSEIARNTQEIAAMAEQSHASASSTTTAAGELAALASRLSSSVEQLTT